MSQPASVPPPASAATPPPQQAPPPQQQAPPPSTRHRTQVDPENLSTIHQRYEDTSLVIYRQYRKHAGHLEPTTYLTFGESKKHFSYSKYGNAAVIIRKSGRNVTKMDEKAIQSTICAIM